MTFDTDWFSVDLFNQWSRGNWYTFDLFRVMFEIDCEFGCAEIQIIILGFGVRIYWSYADTEMSKRVKHQIDKLINDDTT